MNKKGFTLVELLAVIVLLGLVMAIAIPSISAITKVIQKNMLDQKITIIEEAAVLLGEDIRGSVMSSNLKYNNFNCKSFIISDLVPDYLKKDNDNDCLDENSEGEAGCIVNPSDTSKYLDKYEVIIYYQNKRIRAIVDTDDTLTCS